MIAVIGDIHGEFYCFERLVDKIIKKYKIKKFVLIGDLIDRGLYSKEVLNFAIELKKNYDLILILGNHEDMMIDYILNEKRYGRGVWFSNNGDKTVKSFSEVLYNNIYFDYEDISEELRIICEKEINFLIESKLFYDIEINGEKYFFSHAGIEYPDISPYNQLDFIKDEFYKSIKHPYLWARNVDNFTRKIDNFIFVHGHTPVTYLRQAKPGRPYINKDKNGRIISINIDTGCVYGGPLTAMLIDNNGEFIFELEKWR